MGPLLFYFRFSSFASLSQCQPLFCPSEPQDVLFHFMPLDELQRHEVHTWENISLPRMCGEAPKGFICKCTFLGFTHRNATKAEQWAQKLACRTPCIIIR